MIKLNSKPISRKLICCLLIIFISYNSKGQSIADPATGQMDITDQSGTSMNTNFIAPGTVGTLLVPVYNLNQLVPLQPGTCKFIIGLGPYMILDPTFNLANAPLSNYFTWTSAVVGGQVKITGDLTGTLPEDYNGIASFKIKGNVLGTSIIESDFLVTNHNSVNILSDEDPQNNSSTLTYSITRQILPVTFTRLIISKKNCTVQVDFSAENEVNVKHYEIEISKDALNYKKTGMLDAGNKINYKFEFNLTDDLKGKRIFIRVKSLDVDGKYKYSETRAVDGYCNQKNSTLTLYPNPAFNTITVKKNEGNFNGKYSVSILDVSGKLLRNDRINLLNLTQFNLKTNGLATGEYYIKIDNITEQLSTSLKLNKL